MKEREEMDKKIYERILRRRAEARI